MKLQKAAFVGTVGASRRLKHLGLSSVNHLDQVKLQKAASLYGRCQQTAETPWGSRPASGPGQRFFLIRDPESRAVKQAGKLDEAVETIRPSAFSAA